MKKTKIKTIGWITKKIFKTLFITGSFLIFTWIAYCLSALTAEVLSYDPDEYEDPVIELLKY